MRQSQPVVLVILDGFGYSENTHHNAIAQAKKPNLNKWFKHYPHSVLQASGKAVGLPDGYVGNSEVGHLTIGAGRIIPQAAAIIENALKQHTLQTNPILIKNLEFIVKKQTKLHIIGLISDAGVHGTLAQLCAYVEIARHYDIAHLIIHAFLDGRDVAPQSAAKYLQAIQQICDNDTRVSIGSVHGRFYAMDRDQNWDRIKQSYRVLTERTNPTFNHWQDTLTYYYTQGITDEFIPPTHLNEHGIITDGDGIIFTNYRPDRARELTACFVAQDLVPFTTHPLELSCFITPVSYGNVYHTQPLFSRPPISNTLKEVLAQQGARIVSIAETEKYAHVTYFFNGEQEEEVPHETRILIPSVKTKEYVDYPCMSAPAITQAALESLRTNPADFYLINYANADMVGHSGNFEATVKAIECLDHELGLLYEYIHAVGGTLIITADHGKAELMVDSATGQPWTGHTSNPVPFIIIASEGKEMAHALPTQLSQAAPFILEYMGIPVPAEMR